LGPALTLDSLLVLADSLLFSLGRRYRILDKPSLFPANGFPAQATSRDARY
jgi:hypothetical protein